nr:hypothetical protein [Planctomycetota bacterium]
MTFLVRCLALTSACVAAAAAEGAQTPERGFSVPYEMPYDGFLALDVRNQAGATIRRLVVETARAKGRHDESWDLKDDAGQLVPPGAYRWTAVARPPLKLTYGTTVYNAGQPGWFAPAPGKGGGAWMADHSSPLSACAVGDLMFLGSGCAESGHCAIAVDREGVKQWGVGNVLEGFHGAYRVASDGRYAYLCNSLGVQRVDPGAAFARSDVLRHAYTADLPPGAWDRRSGGAVARGDRLYLSFNGVPTPWARSAFTTDEIDGARSFPPLPEHDGKLEEDNFGERGAVAATFSAMGGPVSSKLVWFGDASGSGPLADTLTLAFKAPVAVGSVLLPEGVEEVYVLREGVELTDTVAESADDEGAGANDAFDEATWERCEVRTPAGPAAIAAPQRSLRTLAVRFKAQRIPYALVLDHRFADAAPTASRACSHGEIEKDGSWSVTREPDSAPIDRVNPASLVL